MVSRTSITPGDKINVKNKEVLTVFISSGPDPATTTTTEETTTTPTTTEAQQPEETTAEQTEPVGDRPLDPGEMDA